jgi:FeS assembly SUF system protein
MKEIPVVQPDGAKPPESTNQTASIVNAPEMLEKLKPGIIKALSQVHDPEIPVNIWELGLIYDILVNASGVVGIRMTLTAPGCPAAQSLPGEVRRKVMEVAGVADAKVDVVWEPPWTRDRMSDVARLQLGLV